MTTTRRPAFSAEDTTVLVSELHEGDFLVRFDAQLGLRGENVLSGIKAMSPEPSYWAERYGRARIPVNSTRITTLTGKTFVLPDAHRVVIRRRLR